MIVHDNWLSRCTVALLLPALAACQSLPGGSGAFSKGIVIADETLAGEAASLILRKGGNAADAAVAAGFALTVTFPAAAGLGGGGHCLYRSGPTGAVESIEFLPPAAKDAGPIAVPATAFGLEVLHARHGSKPWAELVAPAERLARDGFAASNAYVRRLAGNAAMSSVPESYAMLFGGILTEGRRVAQPILAGTLSAIGRQGASALAQGPMAEVFVAASSANAGRVSGADLALYRPVVGAPQVTLIGGLTVAVAPAGTRPGAFASRFWPALGGEAVSGTSEARASAALAESGAPETPIEDFGATGFITADGEGGVAICGLTMNGPFGARAMAEPLGFAFALSPEIAEAAIGSTLLQPVLAWDEDSVVFAGLGAGSVKGAGLIGDALIAFAERKTDPVGALLRSRQIGPIDAALVLSCPKGWPQKGCRYSATPGGAGASYPVGQGVGAGYVY